MSGLYSDTIKRLRSADVRPTRQRLALAKLLFGCSHRHVTAESLHKEAVTSGVSVSLATVYNTLHQFTKKGLLREIVVDSGRCYFDTNTKMHHHFFIENTNTLTDISADLVNVQGLPEPPDGATIKRIDVIVRIQK